MSDAPSMPPKRKPGRPRIHALTPERIAKREASRRWYERKKAGLIPEPPVLTRPRGGARAGAGRKRIEPRDAAHMKRLEYARTWRAKYPTYFADYRARRRAAAAALADCGIRLPAAPQWPRGHL